MSTQLIGPYDATHTLQKTRIVCGIPSAIYQQVFQDNLTLRGAQDKVLSRLFHVFYVEFSSPERQAQLNSCLTTREREDVVNEILNHIADHSYVNQS